MAVTVGDALRRAGIRAVLTGGACANLYSGGVYHSLDADFVLSGSVTTAQLDRALAPLGFRRRRDRYVHRLTPYFVEFPAGPLGVGADFDVVPVWRTRGRAKTLALSATDSCRDRLAAYYHWNDRQSLEAAVAIARRHRVSRGMLRAWSLKEGHEEGFTTFMTELGRASPSTRRPRGTRR